MSGYLHYGVSRESNDQLVPFFQKLEAHTEELRIEDCQLSITTLEEVFLKIAENTDFYKTDEDVLPTEKETDDMPEQAVEMGSPLKQKTKKKFSLFDQFKALFIKTVLLQSRDRKTNACQLLTPIVFMSILTLFQLLINSIVGDFPVLENRSPRTVCPFHILPVPDGTNLAEFLEEPDNPVLNNLYQNNARLLWTADPLLVNLTLLGDYQLRSGIFGSIDPPPGTGFPTKFLEFRVDTQLTDVTYFQIPKPMIPFKFQEFPSKESLEREIFISHNELPSIVGGYQFKELNFETNTYRWNIIYNASLTQGEDVPFLMNRITNVLAQNLANPVSIVLKGIKVMPTIASDGRSIYNHIN